MLQRVLATRHSVAISQVDVDVVPGVAGLGATEGTHPLGGGYLGENY